MSQDLSPHTWKVIATFLEFIAFCGTIGLLILAIFGPAHATWRPEMAQLYTPQEQEWFGKQLIPGTHQRCCSTADGTYALEDIRYDAKGIGHYWTKFHTKSYDDETGVAWNEQETDWIEVPGMVVMVGSRHLQAITR